MASWAKMASNLDSHPKIRAAGADGREVFLFVLRRNAELNFGGVIPKVHVSAWYIAYELMRDEVTVSHGLSRCVTAGLLEERDACFVISGWDDEWAKKPLTDAERKAKQRDKERAITDATALPVTNVTTSHNANVTGHGCHAGEKRREEKKRVEESSGIPASPAKRKSPALSLPADWKPNEGHATTATERGVNLEIQARSFRAHAEANDRRAVRWDAAFTQWLLKAFPDRRPASVGRVEPKTPAEYPQGEIVL